MMEDLNGKKVAELKEILRDLGAKVSGTKRELIERILIWQGNGLSRLLVDPVEVRVTDTVEFPIELKPLEVFNLKQFKKLCLSSIGLWFGARQANASMEKGRKLFLSSFVKCCTAEIRDEFLFVKCFCAAETRKSLDYSVQVVIKDDGTVKQCSCSCVAGEGFSAACKHCSALLYCLEHYIGSNILHQLVSKTSQQQEWHKPAPGRHVEHKTAHELSSQHSGPTGIGMTYCPTIDDAYNIALNYKADCLFVREAHHSATSAVFTDHSYSESDLAVSYVNSINHLTNQERTHLEEKTRKQVKSKLWWKARMTRITGSSTKSVVSTVQRRKFSKVPAKNIILSKQFKTKATEWGKTHEHMAISDYENVLGSHVLPTGLYVHPSTEYIGSSPDGITTDKTTVVEVKCPFSLKEDKPTLSTCLQYHKGVPSLKRNHQYYYQIQNHMYCTGIDKCDFVIWTPNGIYIELVRFDRKFVEKMLESLKEYYEKVFCAEVVKQLLDK